MCDVRAPGAHLGGEEGDHHHAGGGGGQPVIFTCELRAHALYGALEDGVRVAAARRCCRPRRSGLRSGSTRKQVGLHFFY